MGCEKFQQTVWVLGLLMILITLILMDYHKLLDLNRMTTFKYNFILFFTYEIKNWFKERIIVMTCFTVSKNFFISFIESIFNFFIIFDRLDIF